MPGWAPVRAFSVGLSLRFARVASCHPEVFHFCACRWGRPTPAGVLTGLRNPESLTRLRHYVSGIGCHSTTLTTPSGMHQAAGTLNSGLGIEDGDLETAEVCKIWFDTPPDSRMRALSHEVFIAGSAVKHEEASRRNLTNPNFILWPLHAPSRCKARLSHRLKVFCLHKAAAMTPRPRHRHTGFVRESG